MVGAIHQDFTSLTIKILSMRSYPLWEKRYADRELFDNDFKRLAKRFDKELKERESEDKNM